MGDSFFICFIKQDEKIKEKKLIWEKNFSEKRK
jgi:hypothetical protein